MVELNRRQLLLGGAALSVSGLAGGYVVRDAVRPRQDPPSGESPASAPPAHRFVSRPDLRPPVVTVTTPARATESGYIFLTPAPNLGNPPPSGAQAGPLIIDEAGQPVWFAPTREIRLGGYTDLTTDLKVQTFRNQRVLTWWRGDVRVPPGFGTGEFFVADRSYRHIATVRAGNGLSGDLHDFQITARDTALIIAYRTVQEQGRAVLEGVVQELDIDTGRVLLEWPSLAHVPLDESLEPAPASTAEPFDYIHLNSVAEDADDTLLVSARHTQAVYRINRRTGAIIWRLGGPRSDFTFGPDADFVKQHDARRLPNGTVSIFDNGAGEPGGTNSRAIALRLNERTRRATLARKHLNPKALLANNQGNAQFLPNGNAFANWGDQGSITEFSRADDVLFDATYGPGIDLYRGFRFEWDATPTEPPAVAARSADHTMTIYASWNGATRVARWRVHTGPSPERLAVAREADRNGFETAIPDLPRRPFIAVTALDANNKVLGRSAPTRTTV